MSRSLKKGVYIHPKLLEKIESARRGSKVSLRTWSRDSMILPEMVGLTFEVHNGKNFISVLATENMVGHRLGEFSPTRKFVRHGGKIQKEIEQKSKTAGQPVATATKPSVKK